ncbi:MAG: tRNA-dihydrouridine synthase family protein [Candidatus Berkelbacteria bacterium]
MSYLDLAKPIIALAPMHGFTNSEFRLKCRKFGADLVYSEMVAAEGIIRRVPAVLEQLEFVKAERPVILQIFGSNPESMATAAQIIENEYSPDGIDINFGCPVQKAAKQGFGAVLLRDPKKAIQIIKAVKKVLKTTPLSVKIRLNDDVEETISFIKQAQKAGVQMVAIHGRTLTQKYRGIADYDKLHLIKSHFTDLIILGSGDIKTRSDIETKLGNLDGVLVGRAAKIRPEVFQELKL